MSLHSSLTVSMHSPPARAATDVGALGLCLVGIDPRPAPLHPALGPVRALGAGVEGVVQLRLGPGSLLDALPGLEDGSRLRDAAALALGAGAPWIDLLLARRPGVGARVWEPRTLALLDPLLCEQAGALLVLPDLPLARAPLVLSLLQADLVTRHQILLLDLAPADRARAGGMAGLLASGASLDVVAVAWDGPRDALERQGWRSAAALLGGALAASEPALSAVGRSLPLVGGRPPRRSRASLLESGVGLAPRSEPSPLAAVLSLDETGDRARLLDDPSLRRPLGRWPLAALRSVKAVMRQLTVAARRFVFHAARESEAAALAAALDASVRSWTTPGLLVGPEGGRPRVLGSIDADPVAPAIVATLHALLQPWATRIDIRVRLAPGEAATLGEI